MSQPRTPRTAPYILSGTWPDATLAPDAPAHVARVQLLCQRVRDALDTSGLSARAVSARAGMATSTLTRVIRGETWCDVATLAALEDALETDLWVSRAGFGHGGTQD